MDCKLPFNDAVGLTFHKDIARPGGRAEMVLALRGGVVRWCEENISYAPHLDCNMRKNEVALFFEDAQDRLLFQLRFAHHFMPAAVHFIPFGDELD